MRLSVMERLVLLNVLPKEGDLTTLRVVRDLSAELSFTEAEHAALGLTVLESGGVKWNAAADTGKEVEVGPTARKIIQRAFKQLEAQKKLKMEFLPLYEQFVEADP